MQAEDYDLGPVFEWLSGHEIPTPNALKAYLNATKKLWDQVPAIHLLDGVMVRKFEDDPTVVLVVPHQLRKSLFHLIHARPLAAHLGTKRVYHQLRTLYYWPVMKKDVALWYQRCPVCAKDVNLPPKGMENYTRFKRVPRWTS